MAGNPRENGTGGAAEAKKQSRSASPILRGDRRFESCLLQRRVREPSVPPAISLARCQVPDIGCRFVEPMKGDRIGEAPWDDRVEARETRLVNIGRGDVPAIRGASTFLKTLAPR